MLEICVHSWDSNNVGIPRIYAAVEELELQSSFNTSTKAADSSNGVTNIPDAVDTVVCVPDDGWKYHRKHIERFPGKINYLTLHLVGYILEYYYDAPTHES
jgi:hypothetical protein